MIEKEITCERCDSDFNTVKKLKKPRIVLINKETGEIKELQKGE